MSEELSFLHDLSYEEELFAANISDRILKAENAGYCRYTMFIGERRAQIALSVMRSKRFSGYKFFGGYKSDDFECRRKMLAVFGEYGEPDTEDFPIRAVTYRYRPCYKLTHRDFLGALMSLDIKRECVGDIIVGEGACVVFLASQTADGALLISKIGNVGVTAQEGASALEDMDLSERFDIISGTVSSLRLDCIAALAAGTARGKAQQLISGKCVVCEGNTVTSDSFKLSEGDSFSIKGHGRFMLAQAGQITRKNRIYVKIKKFK